eukprot:GEMP01081415.1.p1 GENE.GEMP01081415.1~~GEMP01081415.1.p1  ORF type:complete len:250 (+),score=74.80 GEMP01081415.1:126-875(+)
MAPKKRRNEPRDRCPHGNDLLQDCDQCDPAHQPEKKARSDYTEEEDTAILWFMRQRPNRQKPTIDDWRALNAHMKDARSVESLKNHWKILRHKLNEQPQQPQQQPQQEKQEQEEQEQEEQPQQEQQQAQEQPPGQCEPQQQQPQRPFPPWAHLQHRPISARQVMRENATQRAVIDAILEEQEPQERHEQGREQEQRPVVSKLVPEPWDRTKEGLMQWAQRMTEQIAREEAQNCPCGRGVLADVNNKDLV